MPKFRDSDGYDPYRTDPLWESEEPFDYPHDQHRKTDDDEPQGTEPETFDDRPERPVRDFTEPLSDPSHGDSVFRSILSFFLPSVNDSPQEKARHRLILSLGLTAFTVFAIGAMGGFEKVGIGGFAHASDMKVKIETATQPLKEEIGKQTQLLNLVSRQLTDQLAAGTATEIREKTVKRCLEKSRSERERINEDIDRLQDLYFKYKQKYYEYRLTRYEDQTCTEL